MVLMAAVTGGIGAGKSTVARRLKELGAVVIDSDRLARDVVAPGTPGLTAVVAAFGQHVLDADGTLNRAALAAIVFADPVARRRLEAITHPLVRQQFAQAAAAAPADAVVVNDIPLLVDPQVAAGFHLVIGVHAAPEIRVQRLVLRGLAEPDARARIAAQIGDVERVGLCDVWLANDGEEAELEALVDREWNTRITGYRDNLRAGEVSAAGQPPSDSDRLRVRHRLARALGVSVESVEVSGVDGFRLAGAHDSGAALAAAGFPLGRDGRHGSADPALQIQITVSVGGAE